jgi:hypothetical protein
METETGTGFVVAEMNTHHFMFRGAGRDRETARLALLNAWRTHRTALLACYPERTDSIPDESRIDAHFKICYLEFELGAGYRDGVRVSQTEGPDGVVGNLDQATRTPEPAPHPPSSEATDP